MALDHPPSADTDGRTRQRRAWLVVVLLALLMFANFAAKIAVGLDGVPIKKDLSIGDAKFGVIQSSFYWLFAIGSILGGWLGGRFGARWLLGGAALLWALSLAPMAGQIGFTGAVACRVLLGLAEGPTFAIALQTVHSWFPAHRRAVPTTVVLLGAVAGPVLAVPAIGSLTKNDSWHTAFGAVAIFGAAAALLWLLFGSVGPEDSAAHGGSGVTPPPERVPLRHLFRTGTIVGSLALLLVSYGDTAAKLSWLPLFLERGHGYDANSAGLVVAIAFLAAGATVIATGFASRAMTARGLSSRFSRGVLPSALVLAGGLTTCALPLAGHGLLLAVLITLGTALVGGGFGVVFAGLSDVIPPKQRTTVYGVMVAVYSLGAIIAPALIGSLVASARTPLSGYNEGWLIVGVALVLGAATSLLLVNPERDAARLAMVGPRPQATTRAALTSD